MSLTNKDKKRCCHFITKWDIVAGFLFLVVLGTCCQGVHDANKMNKKRYETRP